MIPGTSRSGAPIIGGMLLGPSRQAATEFSYFLAIAALIGAGVCSLYKERALLSLADLPLFSPGLIVSFISACWRIGWLLRYVARHSSVSFACYRIAFGIAVLGTAQGGLVHWVARRPQARATAALSNYLPSSDSASARASSLKG